MGGKRGVNPTVAGIAGVAVGAAATAGAMALSDKKNRKKILTTVERLKVEGKKAINRIKAEAYKIQKTRQTSPKKLTGKTIRT